MPEPKLRDRLVGGRRPTALEVTAGGKTEHPLGDDPLRTTLYTPDSYMSAQLAGPRPYADNDQPDAYYIAYSGPYGVDETNQSAAHHLQVSAIPSRQGTTQLRQVHFRDPDTLTLPVSDPGGGGVTTTTTVSWARQPPR
jgi:Lipocalin-like domain